MSRASIDPAEIKYADREVLSGRRVRHMDGREGVLERFYLDFVGAESGTITLVRWHGERYANWRNRVPAGELTLLPAPPLEVPVRSRRVIYRGTKDQVAEKLVRMAPPADGVERYVEFTHSAVAARRFRIVEVGAPWSSEQVDATPNEAPGAARRRLDARDSLWDSP